MDLLRCDGLKFKCNIAGTVIPEGIVTVENGAVYLCQNERNGNICKNKHGYTYSWGVLNGNDKNLTLASVYDFEPIPTFAIGSKVRIKDLSDEKHIFNYGGSIRDLGEISGCIISSNYFDTVYNSYCVDVEFINSVRYRMCESELILDTDASTFVPGDRVQLKPDREPLIINSEGLTWSCLEPFSHSNIHVKKSSSTYLEFKTRKKLII